MGCRNGCVALLNGLAGELGLCGGAGELGWFELLSCVEAVCRDAEDSSGDDRVLILGSSGVSAGSYNVEWSDLSLLRGCSWDTVRLSSFCSGDGLRYPFR